MNKKNIKEDFAQENYFNGEDDEEDNQMQNNKQQEDDEDDELDAFMKEIDEQAEKDKQLIEQKSINSKRRAGERLDEENDLLDSYMDSLKKKLINQAKQTTNNQQNNKKKQKKGSDSESDYEEEDQQDEQYDFLDSDGEIDFAKLKQNKKRTFKLLEQMDHSKITYEPFTKNFYNMHPDIQDLQQTIVDKIRKDFEIKVKGHNVPSPIVSFGHLGFDEELISLIAKQGFSKPTPIQSQALPVALSGRDLVGVAKTGSGKTVSYVWPLLIHILDQQELQKNQGPIGLILAPTRELCQQIYQECKKYAKIYNISVGALLGGENKQTQWKMLKAGIEILVATPGRLIEMIQKKATNTLRCTYVVIDEADKMFSMGFEKQIRSIIQQIRPDRQTLLFTATLKKNIQNLIMDSLENPVTINIGNENQANEDIRQEPVIFREQIQKDHWLVVNIPQFFEKGKVLIFVNQITSCNKLSEFIQQKLGIQPLILHGDKSQYERTEILSKYKGQNHLLIATDVASRGLNIPEIKTVINYDLPSDIDTYIHRIGRTGRAGATDGSAYSLLFYEDSKFAVNMVKVMELSGQPVNQSLESIAMNDDKFKTQRMANRLGVNFAKGKDASKLLKQALSKQRNAGSKHGLGYQEQKDVPQKDQIKQDIEKQNQQQSNNIQVAPILDSEALKLQEQLLQEEKNRQEEERQKLVQQQQLIKEYQEQLLKTQKISQEQYQEQQNIQIQQYYYQQQYQQWQYQQQLQLQQQWNQQQQQLQNQQIQQLQNLQQNQQQQIQNTTQKQDSGQKQQNDKQNTNQNRDSVLNTYRDQMKKEMKQQFRSNFVSGGTLQNRK